MKTKKCYMIAISLCMLLLIASISVAFAACGGNASVDYYLSLESNGWRTYSSAKDIPEDLHFKADGNTYTLDIALSEGDRFTVNQVGTEEKIGHDQLLSTLENLSEGEDGTIRVVSSGDYHFTYSPEDNALLYSFGNSGEGQGTEPVSGVELDQEGLSLERDAEAKLTATVLPANAQNKNVIWDSDDEEVVTVTSDGSNSLVGLVKAVGYGTAKITVTTVESGYTAECTVTVIRHVSSVNLSASSLKLAAGGEEKTLSVMVSPSDADASYTYSLVSGGEYVEIRQNGDGTLTLKGIAQGKASLKVVSLDNGDAVAFCEITVYTEGSAVANISPQNCQMMIGENLELEVGLDGATVKYVDWDVAVVYGIEPIATVAKNQEDPSKATVTATAFGSTVVTARVTDTEGKTYKATCNILIADEYFFIYGYGFGSKDWDWEPYVDDRNAAERDGLLFTEQSRGIYTLTRYFTPSNGFQIIFPKVDSFRDEETGKWTKNIPSDFVATSTYYKPGRSDGQYISNTNTYFCVNTPGIYTVTLDLTDSRTWVSIKAVTLDVTSVDLTLNQGKGVLKGGESAVFDFSVLPSAAEFTEEQIKIELASGFKDYATYLSYDLNLADKQITVSVNESVPQAFDATLTLTICGVPVSTNFHVLSEKGKEVPVTSVTFEQEHYSVNVNQGGAADAWQQVVKATVNSDATNQNVYYFDVTDYNAISPHKSGTYATVNANTGLVTAKVLGTVTIKAVALADETITDTCTVTFYSDQFYLIGDRGTDKTDLGGWIPLDRSYTSVKGTAFEKQGFEMLSETHFRLTYTPLDNDLIQIAFCGMDDQWVSVINNANFMSDMSNAVGGWNQDYNSTADGKSIRFIKSGNCYIFDLDLSQHKALWTMNIQNKEQFNGVRLDYDKSHTDLKKDETVNVGLYLLGGSNIEEADVSYTLSEQTYLTATLDWASKVLTLHVTSADHSEDKEVTLTVTIKEKIQTIKFKIVAEHHLELTWDEENHWYRCTDEGCTYVEDFNHVENQKTPHNKQSDFLATPEGHYYSCSECGVQLQFEKHQFTFDGDVFDFPEDKSECSVCHFKLFEIEGSTLKAYYGNAEIVQVPDKVTIIGDHAFEGHAELRKLTYSANLTKIGAYAFAGCTNLESVFIGNSVKSIGKYAFDGTAATVTWGDHPNLDNGFIGEYAFYGYLGTEFTIPDTVTDLGMYCFAKSGLVEIVIPDTVGQLTHGAGNHMFQDCLSLKKVVIGKKIQKLEGGYEFAGCTALETVIIRSTGFWMFGAYTFDKCTSLKAIYFERAAEQLTTCTQLLGVGSDGLKGLLYAYSDSTSNENPFGNSVFPGKGYCDDWFAGCWHWDTEAEIATDMGIFDHIKIWDETEETAATSLDMPAILNDRKEYGVI